MRYRSNLWKCWECLLLQWALPKGNQPTLNNVSGKRRQTFNPSLASTFCSDKLQLSLKPGKVTFSTHPYSALQLWVAQRSHCFSQALEWLEPQALQVWCLCLALPACIMLPAPPGYPRKGSKYRKGHSVSFQVPFPGLTRSPVIDTEHRHIHTHVPPTVLSSVPSNSTNSKWISSFKSTSFHYCFKHRLKIVLFLSSD